MVICSKRMLLEFVRVETRVSTPGSSGHQMTVYSRMSPQLDEDDCSLYPNGLPSLLIGADRRGLSETQEQEQSSEE